MNSNASPDMTAILGLALVGFIWALMAAAIGILRWRDRKNRQREEEKEAERFMRTNPPPAAKPLPKDVPWYTGLPLAEGFEATTDGRQQSGDRSSASAVRGR